MMETRRTYIKGNDIGWVVSALTGTFGKKGKPEEPALVKNGKIICKDNSRVHLLKDAAGYIEDGFYRAEYVSKSESCFTGPLEQYSGVGSKITELENMNRNDAAQKADIDFPTDSTLGGRMPEGFGIYPKHLTHFKGTWTVYIYPDIKIVILDQDKKTAFISFSQVVQKRKR